MKICVKLFLGLHRFLFRISKGSVGGSVRGIDILILHTKGRKSGRLWSIPLGYFMDNGNYIIAAFAGGAPTHPAWYHNLISNPQVTIEIKGGQVFSVDAEEAQGSEYEKLWQQFTKTVVGYDPSQHKGTRTIPVMILRPTG